MILKLLRAFDVPEPLVGDLVEERRRGRSRLWLWSQTAVAVLHAIAADVRADCWTATRTALAGAAPLATGAQLSLWLYLQATNHLPFQPWMATWWFVLAWHSYSLPLNILWCATAIAAGRIVARTDRRRRLSFVALAVAAQMPVLIWFARQAVQAFVRVTNPPTLLRFRIAFGVDVFVVMLVMPLCAVAAALKGCTTGREGCTTEREGCTTEREGCTPEREGCTPEREGCTTEREGCATERER